MFGQIRHSPPPPPMPLAIPGVHTMGSGFSRAPITRSAVGLGTASIGVVFIFNLDVRVDESAISDMITKACGGAVVDESTGTTANIGLSPFIQFRRVVGEPFGIALFRAAAPAARAARALTGVTMFGKEIFCQADKRTHQLLEQWRYLRGKELGATIATQGYEIPSNILELVNNELTEQVNKAKGRVIEQAVYHENRLVRFTGLTEMERLSKLEEDRIQEVLVRKAEETGKIDKTNSELRALMFQLKEQERKVDELDRELEKKETVNRVKRKHELKTKTGSLSIFEIRQMIPKDRDSLFRHPIDWEGLLGTSTPSSVIKSLLPWVVRKVKDAMGSYDRELVEYILRRIRLRPDPLEFTTDLRQFMDDDSEDLVKQIWSILVFETIRKQNSPALDLNHYASLLLDGIPPSVGELEFFDQNNR